jgi:hypothetical protein
VARRCSGCRRLPLAALLRAYGKHLFASLMLGLAKIRHICSSAICSSAHAPTYGTAYRGWEAHMRLGQGLWRERGVTDSLSSLVDPLAASETRSSRCARRYVNEPAERIVQWERER